MNEDILRIKKDLETISTAAGLEKPPADQRTVWQLYVNGILGLIWAAYAMLVGPSWVVFIVFPIIVLLVEFGLIHYFNTRYPKRTAAMERAYWASWPKVLIIIGVTVYFAYWVVLRGTFDTGTLLRVSYLYVAGMTAAFAMMGKWYRCFWGMAVPFLLGSMAAPQMPLNMQIIFAALLFAIAQFLAAAILRWQLRELGK